LITVPEERNEPVEKPTVILGENAKGVPEKVEVWFYPGDSVGNEFIYEKNHSNKDLASVMESVARDVGRAAAETAKGVAIPTKFLGIHAEHVAVNSAVAIAHAAKYLVS
jgi:hypothetical protein